MKRTFIYEPVEFGYHHSVFVLKEIQGVPLPISPKVGDHDTLNSMLNIVSNGETVVINPKPKEEERPNERCQTSGRI